MFCALAEMREMTGTGATKIRKETDPLQMIDCSNLRTGQMEGAIIETTIGIINQTVSCVINRG